MAISAPTNMNGVVGIRETLKPSRGRRSRHTLTATSPTPNTNAAIVKNCSKIAFQPGKINQLEAIPAYNSAKTTIWPRCDLTLAI